MSLLRLNDNYRWNLDGIEFAIEERVGEPENFIGRVEEMEYLHQWAGNIRRRFSRSIAFLGRRKVGKSLMLERLYNVLYSEHNGLIPFYYEFREGERSAKDFYLDFIIRFYMQVFGYYTRNVEIIRKAVDTKAEIKFDLLYQLVEREPIPHKAIILEHLDLCRYMMTVDVQSYEYVLSAVGTPDAFATTPGVEERVVQMLDEFQYLNMFIDAGVEDKPCKAYMSTAESRVAPILITGSLMGIVSEELMRWLPHRFSQMLVPKMNPAEAQEMVMNYGHLHGYPMTAELAEYIVYVTNGVPGRIVELLAPKIGKPRLETSDDVDSALEYETGLYGGIKRDWDEYLALAMDAVNDINMRRITYFLCKHEGEWYYPLDLKSAMKLEIEEAPLRKELELLFKYDIVEMNRGRYGGVFDRTLKKVLMSNYADILELPVDEFDSYFRSDSLLDYLKERVQQLELSLADMREVKQKLRVLQNTHNTTKGHHYEVETLLRLLKGIIQGGSGLLEGVRIETVRDHLNYHLESGEELDILLEDEQAVVMVECKNYIPENLDKITPKMVDDFVEKATRLHVSRFADQQLRLAFFSKYGFEQKMETYLTERGIVCYVP